MKLKLTKMLLLISKAAISCALVSLTVFLNYKSLNQFDEYALARQRREINNIMPRGGSLERFLATTLEGQLPDQRAVEEHAAYYEKITAYYPQRADAFGMLGFCYYHLGQYAKAMDAYEEAIRIFPQFFWFHHNLAIIYFETGQYQHSAISIKNAFNSRPEAALNFIAASRYIYLPLFKKEELSGEHFKRQFEEGISNLRALVAFNQRIINTGEIATLKEENVFLKRY